MRILLPTLLWRGDRSLLCLVELATNQKCNYNVWTALGKPWNDTACLHWSKVGQNSI